MTDFVRQALWSAAHLPYWLLVLILVYVGAWSALLLHELAHALVARTLGVRIWGITLGKGPVVWDGQVGACRLRLAVLPLHGHMSLADEDAYGLGYRALESTKWGFQWVSGTSWRAPVISAAGGLANLVGAAGVGMYWLAMPIPNPPSKPLFLTCFVANLAMSLNLVPFPGLDGWRLVVQANAWLRRLHEITSP